jgi:ABC-type lipoprotein release transport system permease subunit
MAYEMGIDPAFLSPIEIYFPARTRKISMTNPAASIESIRVWPSGIFSVNTDIDKDLMILPIGKMQELLEHDGDVVSAVEVRLNESISRKALRNLKKEMSEILGPDYIVKDRYQQNESLYKMMKYEKAAIFMILIFVVIIIAFNIFGSLSMLIIEKKSDIQTLRSLGATDSLIKKIFVLEGWLISLSGLVVGLVLGIGFSLLQQHLGFIKMPGHFVVQAYPIILSWSDSLLTRVGVAVIGYVIATIPALSSRQPQSR